MNHYAIYKLFYYLREHQASCITTIIKTNDQDKHDKHDTRNDVAMIVIIQKTMCPQNPNNKC
jgi:hypothetical protein